MSPSDRAAGLPALRTIRHVHRHHRHVQVNWCPGHPRCKFSSLYLYHIEPLRPLPPATSAVCFTPMISVISLMCVAHPKWLTRRSGPRPEAMRELELLPRSATLCSPPFFAIHGPQCCPQAPCHHSRRAQADTTPAAHASLSRRACHGRQ
jgi:hypothetical protein